MPKQLNEIEHSGIIKSIQDNLITVQFVAESACAACHAKGVCSAADMQEKELIITDSSNQYSIGQKVTILLKESLGFKALFIAYILPLILVFTAVIILTAMKFNEAVVGLSSLAILPIYYLALYILRKNIDKKFTFSIKK